VLPVGAYRMWHQFKVRHELVSILCTPDTLACAWIRPSHSAHPFEVIAYKRISLTNLELAQGRICNPTRIGSHIVSFLTKHNLTNAYITLVLHGPMVHEELISMHTASPQPEEIPLQKKHQLVWNYRYLYSQDNAQAAFYVCGIPQPVLLHYKLLAIRHNLNVVSITTRSMAYLHVYTHVYGTAFRHSQLAYDMTRCDNRIDNLISREMITRNLAMPHVYTTHIDQELPLLTPLFGSWLSEQGCL